MEEADEGGSGAAAPQSGVAGSHLPEKYDTLPGPFSFQTKGKLSKGLLLVLWTHDFLCQQAGGFNCQETVADAPTFRS